MRIGKRELSNEDLVVLELARRLRARNSEAYEHVLHVAVTSLMASELEADMRGEPTATVIDLTLSEDSVFD